MSKQIQLRGDTAGNLATVIPASKEAAINTTRKRLHIGDNSTYGGIPHANYFDVQENTFTYASAGGTANALTVDLPYNISGYVAGLMVIAKATATNTGATTIAVDGGAAKNVYKCVDGVYGALEGGEIINGGVYIFLYDGTQFQIINYEQAGQPSGLVPLATATASATTNLDFTGLITSEFNAYLYIVEHLRPSVDGAGLNIRTSTNNGSTWDSTSGDYSCIREIVHISGGGVTNVDDYLSGASGTNIAAIGTSVGIGNAATEGVSGFFTVVNPLNTARYKPIEGRLSFQKTDGTVCKSNFTGQRIDAADIDAVRVYPSSGNWTSGKIHMLGYNITP